MKLQIRDGGDPVVTPTAVRLHVPWINWICHYWGQARPQLRQVRFCYKLPARNWFVFFSHVHTSNLVGE